MDFCSQSGSNDSFLRARNEHMHVHVHASENAYHCQWIVSLASPAADREWTAQKFSRFGS